MIFVFDSDEFMDHDCDHIDLTWSRFIFSEISFNNGIYTSNINKLHPKFSLNNQFELISSDKTNCNSILIILTCWLSYRIIGKTNFSEVTPYFQLIIRLHLIADFISREDKRPSQIIKEIYLFFVMLTKATFS